MQWLSFGGKFILPALSGSQTEVQFPAYSQLVVFQMPLDIWDFFKDLADMSWELWELCTFLEWQLKKVATKWDLQGLLRWC